MFSLAKPFKWTPIEEATALAGSDCGRRACKMVPEEDCTGECYEIDQQELCECDSPIGPKGRCEVGAWCVNGCDTCCGPRNFGQAQLSRYCHSLDGTAAGEFRKDDACEPDPDQVSALEVELCSPTPSCNQSFCSSAGTPPENGVIGAGYLSMPFTCEGRKFDGKCYACQRCVSSAKRVDPINEKQVCDCKCKVEDHNICMEDPLNLYCISNSCNLAKEKWDQFTCDCVCDLEKLPDCRFGGVFCGRNPGTCDCYDVPKCDGEKGQYVQVKVGGIIRCGCICKETGTWADKDGKCPTTVLMGPFPPRAELEAAAAGFGSETPYSCGPNASQAADGQCYCDSPQSYYEESEGKCVCKYGYAADPAGNCVPEAVGESEQEAKSSCEGAVCPPGQCCREDVFGFDCVAC